ncbi:suberization-associated anionic peroxidase 2-like [Lycium barbarum]|uniref:suberization-associated anionic peroxidase 2-like n=1 Tax=Lycium barbarum TaxID=112863 RepID=UPI00293E7906|nr:suberization-associated anionic peroxidase 2-like [Lycium barbarum]
MGSSATADVVRVYNNNPAPFLSEFNAVMTKMGDLPSGGVQLEIRDVCNRLSQNLCIFGAIRAVVREHITTNRRFGAFVIRLFFHDCFLNGCDGGILLNIPGGELTSPPNANSIKGFAVILRATQRIKEQCPSAAVSCADILAIVARDSVNLLGGPLYQVGFIRRDARTPATAQAALNQLPAPFDNAAVQINKFKAKGFEIRHMVALVGAHSIGFARCAILCNGTNVNPRRRATLGCTCPNINDIKPLDLSPRVFDKVYYDKLIKGQRLLFWDQVLMGTTSTANIVRSNSNNPTQFLIDFSAAMKKLGNLPPVTSVPLEIRDVCGKVNANSIADM